MKEERMIASACDKITAVIVHRRMILNLAICVASLLVMVWVDWGSIGFRFIAETRPGGALFLTLSNLILSMSEGVTLFANRIIFTIVLVPLAVLFCLSLFKVIISLSESAKTIPFKWISLALCVFFAVRTAWSSLARLNYPTMEEAMLPIVLHMTITSVQFIMVWVIVMLSMSRVLKK